MDSGFQKGLDSKLFSVLMSSHFVFVFESCYIERRCLECITSLFSFSIYKLREEMYYCSVRVYGIIMRGTLGRLFTVAYFFVRSFRYTASYRHSILFFKCTEGGGGGGVRNYSSGAWGARKIK